MFAFIVFIQDFIQEHIKEKRYRERSGLLKEISSEEDIVVMLTQVPARPFEGVLSFEAHLTNAPDTLFLLEAPDVPWARSFAFLKNTEVEGKIKFFKFYIDEQNPGKRDYYLRRGLLARAKIIEISEVQGEEVVRYKDKLVESYLRLFVHNEASALILAATIGAKDLLGERSKELFRKLGITHLIVISGFHVGLFYLVFNKVFFYVFTRFRKVVFYFDAELASSFMAYLVSTALTLFSSAEVPSVRALIMLGVVVVGKMLHRNGSICGSLVLAAIIINLLWPGAVWEISFQLTFLAVLGLIAASSINKEVEKRFEKRDGGKFLFAIFSSLTFCLFAWGFTAPVVLFHFNELVYVAPLINLIIIPVFTFFILGGGFLSLLFHIAGINLWQGIYLDGVDLFLQGLYVVSVYLPEPMMISSPLLLTIWFAFIVAVVFGLAFKSIQKEIYHHNVENFLINKT